MFGFGKNKYYHRKIVGLLLACSLFIAFIPFFFKPELFVFFEKLFSSANLCNLPGSLSCYHWVNATLFGIFFTFLNLSLSLLLLFFVRFEIFSTWVSFARIAFPLLILVVSYFVWNLTPSLGGWVGIGSFGSFWADVTFIILPPLFFLLSLVIIIYKSIKLRGES